MRLAPESTCKPSAPTWGWTPPAHAPPGPGWKACPDGYLALEFTSPLCNLSFSKTHNLINVLYRPNNLPCRLTPGYDTLVCSPWSSLWFSTFHLFLQIPPCRTTVLTAHHKPLLPLPLWSPNLFGTQFNCHLFRQVPTAPCTHPCTIHHIAHDCPPAWAILDWRKEYSGKREQLISNAGEKKCIYIWLYGGPCGQWPDSCQPCGLGSGWGEILEPRKADPGDPVCCLGT